jgi:uncharacterized iron-regulated protein
MTSRNLCVLLCLALVVPAVAAAGTKTFHLEIGDPERSSIERDLVIDGIVDTHTGETLSPSGLAARLADKRIVFVGESHTDIEFHNAQLRIIQELVEAGRWVLIGLEMYPTREQGYLDRWSTGAYTEKRFLEASSWYRNWGYNWLYYRDIFTYARDQGLPMFALNTPREVISAVRKKGFKDLTDEEAAQVPTEVDFDSPDHKLLFRTIFDDEDGGFHMQLSDEMLDSFFQAQCTWDATFAHNSLKAVTPFMHDPRVVLVVLVGSGHLVYDLGIQRQLRQWSDLPVATVIPIPIEEGDGERVESVRASYADFLWGLPPATDPIYPSFGASTRAGDGGRRTVIDVPEDSVPEAAGLEVGDVLLAMNGTAIEDRETLMKLMADVRWGDTAVVTVEREGEKTDLVFEFRRTEADDEDEAEDEESAEEHEKDASAHDASHGSHGMPPADMMKKAGEGETK